jgi:hypothetical protein
MVKTSKKDTFISTFSAATQYFDGIVPVRFRIHDMRVFFLPYLLEIKFLGEQVPKPFKEKNVIHIWRYLKT